jgi:ATP-dependent Clp protease ATP-binding subunit ClpA
MFERFTDEARSIVQAGPDIARRFEKSEIRPEHLLLGLLNQPDCLAARILTEHGVERESVEAILSSGKSGDPEPDPLDADALSSLGIDLAAIRGKVEGAFGKGALDRDPQRTSTGRLASGRHVPFSPGAKKALELSLRSALRLGHGFVGDGHLLLGLIRGDDPQVNRILGKADVPLYELREELDRRIPPGPVSKDASA